MAPIEEWQSWEHPLNNEALLKWMPVGNGRGCTICKNIWDVELFLTDAVKSYFSV